MFKLMDKKIITLYIDIFCLTGPMLCPTEKDVRLIWVKTLLAIQNSFKYLARLCSSADWYESHFVRMAEDRVSRVTAHVLSGYKI